MRKTEAEPDLQNPPVISFWVEIKAIVLMYMYLCLAGKLKNVVRFG